MRVTEGYRDGTYLAQCDRCGRMTWANELVAQPLQVAGGGDSGLRVCKHHVDPYHPQNDAQAYTGEDPIHGAYPRPEKRRTSWTGNLSADADDSISISTPTVTSLTPSSATQAAWIASPTIVIAGTNFSASWPTSHARLNGIRIPTTFTSSTSLTCTLPESMITVGSHTLDVENAGPPYQASNTSGLSRDSTSFNTVNQSNDGTVVVS